ncbi:hypothetical protein HK097_010786 [Rhizophlyctis rosea]|uniref:CBM1 domain-containing protein n=1 Tax=Rhizophlyctis rosea TaxID=64517 RepID=A0AAD5S767_9FUNG|nr:hypothetical protein HK097_010786 [Rhizophlyctis rosea]
MFESTGKTFPGRYWQAHMRKRNSPAQTRRAYGLKGTIRDEVNHVPGTGMDGPCGSTWRSIQQNDIDGPGQLAFASINQYANYNAQACHVFLCKGYQFSDSSGSAQRYSAGQTVPCRYTIRAPHPGYANVSIVDTAKNRLIGFPLHSWPSNFATHGNTADQLSFSITIPNLNGRCTQPGECVIQHHWLSDLADQTYQSCVDFTVGESSGGGRNPSVTTARTTTAVMTTATTRGATTTQAAATNCAVMYGQCDGRSFTGPTCCQSGSACWVSNEWYSQCL